MYVYKPDNALPIKIWAKEEELEEGAIKQAENASRLPFAYHHIAVMSDCHQGYGAPIGGVLAAEGVVVVNFIGVDIGCGMIAVKSNMQNDISTDVLKKIMGDIRKAIPLGKNHHKQKQDEELMPDMSSFFTEYEQGRWEPICIKEYNSACKQLGTLGGGNHFIEIQRDQEGYYWVMLHSGSRNLGYKVAKHYNEMAKTLNSIWRSSVPKEYDLAFLPLDTGEGQMYLKEMNYCLDFAKASREHMINKVGSIMWEHIPLLTWEEPINIHHNYATMENHFGRNVMVHRKGATLARNDTIGIIPGSQGTKSYIVKGLGNPDSFNSCSHGAGRVMSRTRAKEELSLEDEIKLMDDQGIVHGIRQKADLDEAPSAYKNIEEVMENQKDLVQILVELSPVASIKAPAASIKG